MSNIVKSEGAALAVTEQTVVSYMEAFGLAKQLTPEEKVQFIEIAKALQLNPFKREIYAVKYGNNPANIVTGYEVYIKRANESGLLAGWSVETTHLSDGDIAATITIHRKDFNQPFKWTALFSEWCQYTKDGAITKFWQKKSFMTQKTAISQGFRLCFPEVLAGMPYTNDEMNVNVTYDTSYEDVKDVAEKPAVDPKLVAEYVDLLSTFDVETQTKYAPKDSWDAKRYQAGIKYLKATEKKQ